jgi:membrane protein implicated in regulation of membrane protease activity
MPEKYHVAVTVGYAFVIGVIVLVLRMSAPERMALWLIALLLFASVLWRIRKGAEPAKQYDLHA